MYGPLLFGIFSAFIGLMLLRQYYRDEKRKYDIIYGKIIQNKESETFYKGKKSIGYIPVIEYRYNGKTYCRNHRVESSKYGKGMKIVPNSKYRIGDEVEIRVYVDEPEYALINDVNNIRLPLYVGIPLTIIGVLITIIFIINL